MSFALCACGRCFVRVRACMCACLQTRGVLACAPSRACACPVTFCFFAWPPAARMGAQAVGADLGAIVVRRQKPFAQELAVSPSGFGVPREGGGRCSDQVHISEVGTHDSGQTHRPNTHTGSSTQTGSRRASICHWLHRLCGDMLHLLSIMLLIFKVQRSKSCVGVSCRMQDHRLDSIVAGRNCRCGAASSHLALCCTSPLASAASGGLAQHPCCGVRVNLVFNGANHTGHNHSLRAFFIIKPLGMDVTKASASHMLQCMFTTRSCRLELMSGLRRIRISDAVLPVASSGRLP